MKDVECKGCIVGAVLLSMFIIAMLFIPPVETTQVPVPGNTVTIIANGITYKDLEYLKDGPSDDSDSIICRDTDGTIRMFVGSYEISLEVKAEKDEKSELSTEVVDRNDARGDFPPLPQSLLR